MYIFNRRQDEELDALSASVQRIGGVGLTIHDELVGQVFPSCMCNNSYGHPLPRLVIPFFMQKCIFYCIFIKLSNPSSCQYLRSVSHCSGEAFGWAEPRDGNYFKSAWLCAGVFCIFCSISMHFVMSLLQPFPLIFWIVQRASHEIACLLR